jgi:hypothetical protein
VTYQDEWERLLAALDEWTSAHEVKPGRIEVVLPDAGTDSRSVQIVITPTQWSDMAGTVFGGFEYALDYVKETLTAWDGPYPYAVFSTYDLVPSESPELPEDPELQRLQELAREHPEGVGGWFTYDGEGTRREFKPEQD